MPQLFSRTCATVTAESWPRGSDAPLKRGASARLIQTATRGATLVALVCAGIAFLPKSSAQNTSPAAAAESRDAAKPDEARTAALTEGHSVHGEIFNEGPRQAAHLMTGVGLVRFPVTTANEDARKFVEQGIAQLHGFWYFESERSFRQAATLDPDCAAAYWGMAMSNRGNATRAKGFIAEAIKRKDMGSRRELLLIEAFERYITAIADKEDEKKKRADRYVSDLEDLLIEIPADIETQAFLCEFLWSGRREGLEMTSNLSVNAMIQDVLDREPLHPIHHYRIHLWDGKKPELALQSAALCGLAAPTIAHMWHMPGHIYSKLHRYHDAVYQQEASARVDHGHMMEDRVLPDQIHNFAHNNEWCIRNLISIGRVHDAEALARNMISMPRHPKYNTIGRSGSFKNGRERLLDVLRAFEMHESLAALSGAVWMEDTGDVEDDQRRDRAAGSALAALGRTTEAAVFRDRFQKLFDAEKQKQTDAVSEAEKKATEAKSEATVIEKAKKDAEEKFAGTLKRLEKTLFEIDGHAAALAGEHEKALDLLTKAEVAAEVIALQMVKAGKIDDAIKKAGDNVNARTGEVRPLAAHVEVLFAAGKKEEAKTAFELLRKLSSTIDLDVRPFARLAPIATEFGFNADWRVAREMPADIGTRPVLDALGPFRWSPVTAPGWALPDVDEKTRSLSDYRGRPVIVVFYLGYGCLHCAEQLQAMAKAYPEFQKAGFDIIAVSTDTQVNLKRAYENYEGGFPFPLVADSDMTTFRQYRCHDDFEQAALHGTFIIDATGKIRWQDISYEPFKDTEFLLKEAVRLISLEQPAEVSTSIAGAAE